MIFVIQAWVDGKISTVQFLVVRGATRRNLIHPSPSPLLQIRNRRIISIVTRLHASLYRGIEALVTLGGRCERGRF